MTNKELVLNFDFRTSEVKDTTDAGFTEAQKLKDRRNKISEEAYGSITQEEQEQLDKLVVTLTKNYETRGVNYTTLENMTVK